MEDNKIFWLDQWEGEAMGGYYFRAFELNKFIKRLEEEEGKKVVGLEIDGNNINVIVKKD
tara:strand:- start:195 stop:374 length:180 start_codon:yes stop_codon:yes gene_type:complete